MTSTGRHPCLPAEVLGSAAPQQLSLLGDHEHRKEWRAKLKRCMSENEGAPLASVIATPES